MVVVARMIVMDNIVLVTIRAEKLVSNPESINRKVVQFHHRFEVGFLLYYSKLVNVTFSSSNAETILVAILDFSKCSRMRGSHSSGALN